MPQQCIFILGMHRSGTSALAGMINLLGIDLGKTLLAPKEENEKGFWENRLVVETHERLLMTLLSSWDDLGPLPEKWWEQPKVAPFKEELSRLLAQEFSTSILWGLKDPRLCRLLPLWLEIFRDASIQPAFIIMTRSPAEVAASLEQRNGFPEQKSLLLWLLHLLDAERWSRGFPRVLVDYDELLGDWHATTDRIASALEITWPVAPALAAQQVSDFLSPNLRHHRLKDNSSISPSKETQWCREAATLVKEILGGNESRMIRDQLSAIYNDIYTSLAPCLTLLQNEIQQRMRQIARKDEDWRKETARLCSSWEEEGARRDREIERQQTNWMDETAKRDMEIERLRAIADEEKTRRNKEIEYLRTTLEEEKARQREETERLQISMAEETARRDKETERLKSNLAEETVRRTGEFLREISCVRDDKIRLQACLDEALSREAQLARNGQILGNLAPLVSIIIVNFNGLRFLPGLLSSLSIQSYPRFEIVFVDNASSDNSVSFVRNHFPATRVIESRQNLGFAGGNNLGMQAARGELIALINNDTVVDENWLLRLVEEIQQDIGIGAVGSKIVFFKPYLEFLITAQTFSPAAVTASSDQRELGLMLDESSSLPPCDYRKPIFSEGFYGSESAGERKFQWSGASARIMLPFDAETSNLSLHLLASGSPWGKGNHFSVSLGGQIIGEGVLDETFSEYRFPIPATLAINCKFNLINNVGTLLDEFGNAQDRGIYQSDRGQFDLAEDQAALCGAAMLIRRSALDRVGGFDAGFFMYYEDVDLSWRLRRNGYRLRYAPTSVVRHIHTGSSKEWSPLFIFHTARNRVLIRFNNAPWVSALQAYLIEIAACLLTGWRAVLALIKGRQSSRAWEDSALRLKIQLSLIKRIPLAIAKRLGIISNKLNFDEKAVK